MVEDEYQEYGVQWFLFYGPNHAGIQRGYLEALKLNIAVFKLANKNYENKDDICINRFAGNKN